jgi:hypothetical protein
VAKVADQRHRLGFALRIFRPQAKSLAEIGQDRGVLGERRAVIEAEHRHAAERVELEIGFRALLAAGEIDFARLVFFTGLLEHDV